MMVNYIWGGMILLGLFMSAVNGSLDKINQSIFNGAKTGVTISFTMISFLVLWMGLMKIAEDAGLLAAFAKLMKPVVRFLFPEVPPNHPALGYILSNMSANLLGLGNAATPMGLKAMKELQEINANKKVASRSMITFLVLNTSGLTFIPTTIIGYRIAAGSNNPVEIVGATLLATITSTSVAIFLDRIFHRFSRSGEGR
ncbi:spore maturation protein [[Clostridium] ultunense Esp]|nr:spore maturation protein [[Clostridium] ultunense Esp]